MELHRGVCSLCSESGKVLTSSDAEHFCKLLPQILQEKFLTEEQFEEIKSLLKICSVCCYKVQVANEIKQDLKNIHEDERSKDSKKSCYFCEADQSLLEVESNWQYFTDRTEGLLKEQHFPICVCPRCIFYFDVIFSIKTKLTVKFPQLIGSRKKKQGEKQNDTPKRKSLPKSPPSSKKRKIFNNCFTYLQPLSNSRYNVGEKVKSDKRLYRKVPYVDLHNSQNVDSTPKTRPAIKIKLRPNFKKLGRGEILLTSDDKLEENFTTKTFVAISRSEEVKSVRDEVPAQKPSVAQAEAVENSDLDETPKAPTVAKRRVSLYTDEVEEDQESTKSEEIDTTEKHAEKSDEIKENMEKNGIDQPEQNTNGDGTSEISDSSNLAEESVETFAKGDDSSNDSDSSHRIKSGSLDESLNGSERKKKRVTFSDEFN